MHGNYSSINFYGSPSAKKTMNSITAFKNQIHIANTTLEIKHQKIIFQNKRIETEYTAIESLKESPQLLMNLPKSTQNKTKNKENMTTVFYDNSPGPNPKRKESENRGFLSEQKENHLKKVMDYKVIEKKPLSTRIYFPLSSPNAKNFNSPTKLPMKEDSRNNSNQKPQQQNKTQHSKFYNAPENEQKQKNNQFFNSLKMMSEEFITNTSDFINSNFNKMSDRKQCSCDIGLSKVESCKTALKWFKSNQNKTAKLTDLKSLYENLQKEKPDEKIVDQIRRDVSRTYSNNSFFCENSIGQTLLERMLITYSKYDTEIKYCQGMNYIAANLLYHAEEPLAFWLFDHLFKKFQIRDLYMTNFPGLSKHLQLIDIMIMLHMPDLYSHLCKNNIKSDMFCVPWIFSLFGVLIPIEELVKFYDNFIDFGWSYFYKVVIAYLAKNKQEIIQADCCDILEILSKHNYKMFNEKDYKDQRLYWRNILRNADNVVIRQDVVKYLHSTYNSEKRVFKI